jgi:3-hydroxybutyryl-CoA dehydratase
MSAAIPTIGAVLTPWRHEVLAAHVVPWSQLLADPNPIHLDVDAVKHLGIGVRAVNQGPANIAYLYNMLAENLPEARVVTLEARLVGTIWVGDLIEVSGRITAVESSTTDVQVRCALQLRALPDGLPAVIADAELRFGAVA